MPSLQLLQLTDRGRGLLASRRSAPIAHKVCSFFSCHSSQLRRGMRCLSPYRLSCGIRRTLAVVSGALIAGGALAYARSSQSQRSRRSEANYGSEASELATNGDGLSQNCRLAATKQKKSGLKSLHFLTAILLKKIGPNGTRYLLGLVLTAVSSTIFYDECILFWNFWLVTSDSNVATGLLLLAYKGIICE